ncbi:unnamed protein product, partial [Brassica oleracea]
VLYFFTYLRARPSKHQVVALRVVFRQVLIVGTVDFIFGNAAIVLQDCDIHTRRPNSGQKKKWSRPKEGLILTRTQGSLSKDVGSVPHRICSPWSEWTGTFALNTLTYREYANKGAGAGTARRVRWRGFKVITAASEAQRYTAGQFVGG